MQRGREPRRVSTRAAFVAVLTIGFAGVSLAGEWVSWRGPHGTGVSDETGLPDSWSPEGENSETTWNGVSGAG